MNRLKELRKNRKISQDKLSQELNVNLRTIQRWESGISNIKPEKAQQLAKYFDVSIGYLLGYEHALQVRVDRSHLSKQKQYILKMNDITIDLICDVDNMTAQEVSNIKIVARELYETLVWLQYETEKVEG